MGEPHHDGEEQVTTFKPEAPRQVRLSGGKRVYRRADKSVIFEGSGGAPRVEVIRADWETVRDYFLDITDPGNKL